MIIETHLHLCDEKFDADRDGVLDRARQAGVTKIINIGAELKEVRKIAAMDLTGVYKAMGLHPHNAHEFSEEVFAEIKGYLRGKGAVAVGEIGLDYYKSTTPAELQEKVFRKFLEAANELDLPVVIHSREAHQDTYKILREFGIRKRGIIHCFTGGVEDALKFTELGYVLGIGGVVTFPNAGPLRDAVKEIPLERLVLETDAPWLAPKSVRGKRNEPAYLREIAAKVAEIKNVSTAAVEESTTAAAERVLGI
jgi:TatD DNase family protein